MQYNLTIEQNSQTLETKIVDERRLQIVLDDKRLEVEFERVSPHQLHLVVGDQRINVFVSGDSSNKTIHIDGSEYQVQDADLSTQRSKKKGAKDQLPTEITPQTPSVVVSVLVDKDQPVEKGQDIVVLSAMKMETTLKSPFDGVVSSVNVAEGDKVAPGDILVDIAKTG